MRSREGILPGQIPVRLYSVQLYINLLNPYGFSTAIENTAIGADIPIAVKAAIVFLLGSPGNVL